ncbi:MAG: hypothetical protein KAU90_04945, partial [Sulfurovaceae bacterium]|nr:hypothetical protein [Sulfurovaceae bacterium]
LEIISSKNKDIIQIYKALAQMINTTRKQISILNAELETYGNLSNSAKDMFSTIEDSIGNTEEKFKSLTETIKVSNSEQKESFLENNNEIKAIHKDTTEHIKENNDTQSKDIIKTFINMVHKVNNSYTELTEIIKVSNGKQKENFLRNNQEIKDSYISLTKHMKEESNKQIVYNEKVFEELINNFEKNKKELDIISNHFKNLGIEIPKALEVSLNELNRGLTSLTIQFQKDYQETLNQYNKGLNNGRR